tara:strand:- start:686 stop:1243 length:558 start_codon:yes stop_codon:yes gene_type:complete
MFDVIDGFYSKENLGLTCLNFLNSHFHSTYQSEANYYGGDRNLAYPTHETKLFHIDTDAYKIFVHTFEKKTNVKILKCETFFRKTKRKELTNASSWNQYKPHTDGSSCDVAGLIYFNSYHIKDGTYLFNSKEEYEPTAIIGAKPNRCVFYKSNTWHCPPMEQKVEERWTQPFFISYKKETSSNEL